MDNNPYGKYVAGEDLLATLAATPVRIAAAAARWTPETWDAPIAPGKWSPRQILIHLAQCEIVFSNRLRFSLAEEEYVLQPFDQDRWMAVEPLHQGKDALDTYLTLRRLNLRICNNLGSAERQRTFVHPEKGRVSVDWLLTFFAGHERHHLPQIEAVQGEAL